jgi:MYXO-CTERM domain-containing protein
MKKILALLSIIVAPSFSEASGRLTFFTTLGGDPFVYDTDGTTKLGSGFKGQIFAGPDANSLVAVTLVGGTGSATESIAAFSDAVQGGILTGADLLASNVGDSASGVYQLRAWEGSFATFADAQSGNGKWGMSDVVTATFGAQSPTPVSGPNVNGFTSFSLVPEPGTVTLGLLGLGGLVASRRRKNV